MPNNICEVGLRQTEQFQEIHFFEKASSFLKLNLYGLFVGCNNFVEFFLALLRDEDALGGRDTATARQTVVQCDLCFGQFRRIPILKTHTLKVSDLQHKKSKRFQQGTDADAWCGVFIR